MNPLETPLLFNRSLMDLLPIISWFTAIFCLLMMTHVWPVFKERGLMGKMAFISCGAIGLLMFLYVICLPLAFL